jgi:DNA-binding Lrp family transcriptional regulator
MSRYSHRQQGGKASLVVLEYGRFGHGKLNMVMAVVLINVEAEATGRVATELTELSGVSEVFSVAGNYDLVAVLRVADNESLADLVTARIRGISGIRRTETLIAFRTYSRKELGYIVEE